MLDDAEQRRLLEMDARLTATDPKLARALSRSRVWQYSRAVTAVIFVCLLIVAGLVGVALGGPPAALEGGLLGVAATAGFWLSARLYRGETDEVADPGVERASVGVQHPHCQCAAGTSARVGRLNHFRLRRRSMWPAKAWCLISYLLPDL